MNLGDEAVSKLQTQIHEGTRVSLSETAVSTNSRRILESEYDLADLFHQNLRSDTDRRYPPAGQSVHRFLEESPYQFATDCVPPDYDHHEKVTLPDPEQLEQSLSAVLTARRSSRSFSGAGISRQTLSTLLYHGAGQTRVGEPGPYELPENTAAPEKGFRTYPSPGRLYPVDLYVAVVNGHESIQRGIYYYHPPDHHLRRLSSPGPTPEAFEDCWGDDVEYGSTAVTVLLVGAFARAKAKYGIQGYPLLFKEAGHLCQNLQLATTALDLQSVPSASYRESEVADLVGANGTDADVVHSLAVGHPPEADGDE